MNIRDRFFNRKIGKAEKTAIVVLSLLLTFVFWAGLQKRFKLGFQYDDSVDFRFCIVDKRDRVPQKDAYCAFKFLAVISEPRYGQNFVKRVGCLPGEALTHRDRDYYCNGEYLGSAKKYNKKGQFLPIFDFNGPVPDGKFFALGETLESYDSKFWGFVDYEWIIGKAHKIF